MENEANEKSKNKSKALDEAISMCKNQLTAWNKTLTTPNFNFDSDWKIIKFSVEREMEKIQYLLERYQSDLLLNKQYEFQLNPSNFGNFKVKNKEIVDENRLEGTIKMVVNEFSSFKTEKIQRFSKNYCIINNISWNIETRIEENDTHDLSLGFYVKPDGLGDKPVNTKITLQIIQYETKATMLTLKGSFDHVFSEESRRGFKNFILLREIIDPLNGIYDKINDSITLEANIKIQQNVLLGQQKVRNSQLFLIKKQNN